MSDVGLLDVGLSDVGLIAKREAKRSRAQQLEVKAKLMPPTKKKKKKEKAELLQGGSNAVILN